jgi:hypothetical protein
MRALLDVYLLALPVRNGGRFITFDGSVPLSAVRGARGERLTVI